MSKSMPLLNMLSALINVILIKGKSISFLTTLETVHNKTLDHNRHAS